VLGLGLPSFRDVCPGTHCVCFSSEPLDDLVQHVGCEGSLEWQVAEVMVAE
jgi:hypothetical protein